VIRYFDSDDGLLVGWLRTSALRESLVAINRGDDGVMRQCWSEFFFFFNVIIQVNLYIL
jgi:hypothetical protein